MAKENFERCLEHVFKSEGGYVNHPRDPGGATNMGITHKTLAAWRGHTVTREDVKKMPRSEAAAIYRANYWNAVRGDELPLGVDLVAFDAAVNSGVSRGAKWVQRALDVAQDGRIGPDTIKAAKSANAQNVINRALTYRLDFLRGLKTWDAFGKGWQRRVDGVRAESLAMAATTPADTDDKPSALAAILRAISGGWK